jgi:hypothetical protein
MTLNAKITEIKDWYRAQIRGDVRLFKGEDNEMTTENIWTKLNHYGQLSVKIKQGKCKPQWEAQINRAYYYNVECWPLERIRKRYERLNPVEEVAA